MTNEEMSQKTRCALAAALKSAMERKPLSRITVSELIRACNINRNTFYYHFDNLESLLKWTMEQDAIQVIRQTDLLVDAEQAIRFVMDYVDRNRHVLFCALDSLGQRELRRLFYKELFTILRHTIDAGEAELCLCVDPHFKDFLAAFYTEALVGILLSWMEGKETDPEALLQNILFVCQTSIPALLAQGHPNP